MRLSAALLLAVTTGAGGAELEQVGTLANAGIAEASGLARSAHDDDLLWVINDGGSGPDLYAIGADGRDRGKLAVDGATNVDWEDLAAFAADGRQWLLVADIGDNQSAREHVTLYIVEEPVVEEPALPPDRTLPARAIRFVYPDGPRDAEAAAVVDDGAWALILTKRTLPAELYAVPLQPDGADIVIAKRIGDVAVLPQPTEEDLRLALPNRDWHWQPTAMDVSADGREAVILTYRALYRFERGADQRWENAFAVTPTVHPLGDIREAEAVAFAGQNDTVFVTVELEHAPVFTLAPER